MQTGDAHVCESGLRVTQVGGTVGYGRTGESCIRQVRVLSRQARKLEDAHLTRLPF